MAAFVTLAMAVAHLKLGDTFADGSPMSEAAQDLQRKLDMAEVIVLDDVKQRRSGATEWAAVVDGWSLDGSPAQVPPPAYLTAIQAATLELTGSLWRTRGDDDPDGQPKQDDGRLPPRVRMYLAHLRDPTIA